MKIDNREIKRGYKRIKQKPKYGKYLYEYIYKTGADGFPESFLGKNKYYIIYKKAEKIFYVSKGNKNYIIQNINRGNILNLMSDKEKAYERMNRYARNKSSMFFIPHDVKIYSFNNISHVDAALFLEEQCGVYLLDDLKRKSSRITSEINKIHHESTSKIEKLKDDKEKLLKRIEELEVALNEKK